METGSRGGVPRGLWSQVWRQVGPLIAGFMDTEDWWKASGATRELSQVQPDMIGILPISTHSLCWIARRWNEVKLLVLDHNCRVAMEAGATNTDQCNHAAAVQATFQNVVHKLVDAMTSPTSLNNLQVLRLVCDRFDDMGVLTQLRLKHLELSFKHLSIPGSCAALGIIGQLETVALKNVGDEIIVPNVHLHGCARLRAFASTRILFDALQVPDGCLVQLDASCEGLTSHWSPACTSCICRLRGNDAVQLFLSTSFAALTSLELGHLSGFALLELGQSCPNLQSLSISGRSIELSITATLPLISFQVLAETTLRLSLSDAASMAATLQAYRFRCHEPWMWHSDLCTLLEALDAVGKGGTLVSTNPRRFQFLEGDSESDTDGDNDHDIDTESDSDSQDDIVPQPPMAQTARKSSGGPPAEFYWVDGVEPGDAIAVQEYFAACSCGACWSCLEDALSIQCTA